MSARGKCVRTRAAAADGVGPARTSPEVLIAVVEAERGEWGWMAEGACTISGAALREVREGARTMVEDEGVCGPCECFYQRDGGRVVHLLDDAIVQLRGQSLRGHALCELEPVDVQREHVFLSADVLDRHDAIVEVPIAILIAPCAVSRYVRVGRGAI